MISSFENEDDILEVHVFTANEFVGMPIETEEMRPEWFRIENIPYGDMWPDDKYWIPLLLEKKRFTGRFLFRGHNEILEEELTIVDSL